MDMRMISMIALMLGAVNLTTWAPVRAADLPAVFERSGEFWFAKHGRESIGTGIPSIEIGPQGKLWLFEPFKRTNKKYKGGEILTPGQIQTIDPIDGIFFNGNDQLSPRFGESKNGAVFTPDGQLLTYAAKWKWGVLRDAVDGQFFNENDKNQRVSWPFGALLTVGTPEPSPAAFGPGGVLYFTVPYMNQVAVFDFRDGNLSNDNFTFKQVNLPVKHYGQRPMGITFDSSGHLYLSSRNYQFSARGGLPKHVGPAIIGIQSVDGTFFNDDDIRRVYDVEQILEGVPTKNGPPLLIDLAFDRRGHLFAFDSRNEVMYQLTPSTSSFPSTVLLSDPLSPISVAIPTGDQPS